ncbi:hypothetical protein EEX84_10800 [Planococcus salinus]|uniref:Uncharacterized protein n=1 Tax=Planococcus salinus TaxID=1848460 RepID=A0A3M8P7C4_9BACL|nr:hypothetical protein EEX84_10800 [Planococcus salinus]
MENASLNEILLRQINFFIYYPTFHGQKHRGFAKVVKVKGRSAAYFQENERRFLCGGKFQNSQDGSLRTWYSKAIKRTPQKRGLFSLLSGKEG